MVKLIVSAPFTMIMVRQVTNHLEIINAQTDYYRLLHCNAQECKKVIWSYNMTPNFTIHHPDRECDVPISSTDISAMKKNRQKQLLHMKTNCICYLFIFRVFSYLRQLIYLFLVQVYHFCFEIISVSFMFHLK